jgi:hypothetical protein
MKAAVQAVRAQRPVQIVVAVPVGATAYLCGHPEMIRNAKEQLNSERWTKESVREEQYVQAVASGDSPSALEDTDDG